MKKKLFNLLLLCLFLTSGFAQKNTLKFTNAKDFDETRYEDIDGSPYYFKDWVYAKIYATDRSVYEDVLVNYNGETENFEAKKDNQWISLDNIWYSRVEIKKDQNEDVLDNKEGNQAIFQRVIYPNFKDKFYVVIYEGESRQIIKEFRAVISTKTVQDVGKTVEMKRFNSKKNYYLIEAGKVKLIKLKKKTITQLFAKPKDVEGFMKKEKINLNVDADLRKLFEHFEKS